MVRPHGESSPGALPGDEIEDRFYRLLFGLPPSPPHGSLNAAEQTVLRRVREAFGGERVNPDSLPHPARAIPTALAALHRGFDARALATIVAADAALAEDIVHAASRLHARPAKPPNDLIQAVTRLGPHGLPLALVRSAMQTVLRGPVQTARPIGDRLWEHAGRCARACAFLGQTHCDPVEAHLAGLLSQAGAPSVIRELDAHDDTSRLPASRPFVAALTQQVERLSLHAARQWALPSRVVQALAERADPADAGARTPLGRALLAASRVAMLDVLIEQGLVPADACLLATPQQGFSPSILAACREELRTPMPATALS